MCTVTFIPKSQNGFILTSNRDEAPGRATFPPNFYIEDGIRLLYPRDAVANGTWIGISEKKRAISLMNGGFEPHKRQSYYRKSRGIVVKEFLVVQNLDTLLSTYNFLDIEPFTAVIVDWLEEINLTTLVWDGNEIHKVKEPITSKIWSSSPLYPRDIRLKREQWFSEFLIENENPTNEKILHFHKNAGEGNPDTNLIMDRGFVRTKSITQIIKDAGLKMRYEDLQSGESCISLFQDL
ncbi:hypothetical protein EI546_14585 [Aequorivita sp. H23M31]|uniref:NRDE family protein n=1 Tax=Aequorivita ciconiae TaxID=2494375 RepID=A0A410G6F6_9FLAO|nr:NRDE family protein [Aequorivita sp. H23M31]QAA82869.1 hypothetical protein EI546_14585 [Aequorivita sp. H23M31]